MSKKTKSKKVHCPLPLLHSHKHYCVKSHYSDKSQSHTQCTGMLVMGNTHRDNEQIADVIGNHTCADACDLKWCYPCRLGSNFMLTSATFLTNLKPTPCSETVVSNGHLTAQRHSALASGTVHWSTWQEANYWLKRLCHQVRLCWEDLLGI